MPNSSEQNIQASSSVKHSLAEQVMKEVPDRPRFTGQATLEIHCKGGEVKDVFLTTRRKMGET
jgi:hypothetical protein